jgi:hypothetical protein
MNPQEMLESMIDNAWTDFNEIAKTEEEDDYSDAMLSMERTEAQGYAEGLSVAYSLVYDKPYNPKVSIFDPYDKDN